MSELEVRDVVVEAGGQPIVEGLSFSLHAGDKMGVVGDSGGRSAWFVSFVNRLALLRYERSARVRGSQG